ncbi:MAG: MBL fold metallo-hydrolase [Deltaproteobacteria bacterium]|jgi:7,8-dihydropterin-6-yl-methyl-4-(beta-D-ribofuranosyl)aminobenzene 5'-phosphate synthase|nr:MBL fold metallo-hydrolase [Deltaproteobacteria bacterium]
MKVKITTLVENAVGIGGSRELIGEHGLAFLIETGAQRILFDTGQYLALENNARVLDSDLATIDTVVLSHGHYDHTGGLRHLLEHNPHFSLYAHPDVFARKLIKRENRYREVGIPVAKEALVQKGVKLYLDAEPVEIAPNILTTGEIPLESRFESVAHEFFVEKDGHQVRDTLADDQALILNTGKGPVVILGCSHRGIINTLNHVKKISGQKTIYALMGGLHLVKTTGEKLDTILQYMQRFNLEKMVVGHCTGSHAIQALNARFKDKVAINTVGHTITF